MSPNWVGMYELWVTHITGMWVMSHSHHTVTHHSLTYQSLLSRISYVLHISHYWVRWAMFCISVITEQDELCFAYECVELHLHGITHVCDCLIWVTVTHVWHSTDLAVLLPKTHVCNERWGAGVETQKNVRGEIVGWVRLPFNEPYAPLLSTIYDGA